MKPVAITGMGAVTAYGIGVDALLDGVASKRSAIESSSPIAEHPRNLGATIPDDFDATEHLPGKLARKMARSQAIGAIAVQEAIRSAHGETPVDPRCGLFMGSAFGPMDAAADNIKTLKTERRARLSPFSFLRFQFSGVAAWPAIQHNLQGPGTAVSAFQATGLVTVGQAARCIREGRARQMVAGAADAIREELHLGLSDMGAIDTDHTRPSALRAFDENATGTILGEGAGAFFLEDGAHAAERNAVIHARVLGFGQAHSGSAPDRISEDPTGLSHSIATCLGEAEAAPEDIELIVATGSGIPAEDRVETDAIAMALGGHARKIPILALKGYTGHTMGASGIIESIIAINSARKGLLPGTPGLDRPISSLLHVRCEGREHSPRSILVLAHGIGGTCAALMIEVP